MNVDELAGLQRLGVLVQGAKPRHLDVRVLGVHAHHFGVIERGDERQRVPGRGQIDVRARLVAEPLHRLDRILADVNLGALAAAPIDVDLGPQFGRHVDVGHHLLDGVRPHPGVVAGERTILEHRVAEEVRGGGRAQDARGFHRPLGFIDDRPLLGRRRVHRPQVVIVVLEAVDVALAEAADSLDAAQGRPRLGAERVTAAVHDRPEAKREFVGPLPLELFRHGYSPFVVRVPTVLPRDHVTRRTAPRQSFRGRPTSSAS